MRAMNIERTRITGGFWYGRMKNAASRVLWEQLAILRGERPELAHPSPVVENFRIAAGLSRGPYRGRVYSDSELGKWIEAASYSLERFEDPALEKEIDALVDLMIKAQMSDGYLNTYFQVLRPQDRLKHYAFSCELYNMGHLMEASAAYYHATGKRPFLEAMCRAADLLCQRIGPLPHQQHVYDGHAEIELGLLRLYEATGCRCYLDLARYFVDERGKQPCFFLTEALLGDNDEGANDKWFGPDHHQAHMPVRLQRKADGHAVKVTYLYSAVAELAALGEDADGTLFNACRSVWENMARHRMYLTGAIGSQGYAERFTVDDDLPPDRSYAETCASVGLCFWARRMLTLDRDAGFADVMERALYNGMLVGWSLEGNRYFYVNVLHSKPSVTGYREDNKHIALERQSWFECACCPSNLLRVICRLDTYLYGTKDDTLYVDGYAQGSVCFRHNAQSWTLGVKTDYPYDGLVCMTLSGGVSDRLRIALRKPDWCDSYALSVNNVPFAAKMEKGYLIVERLWSSGDLVQLRMDMPAQYIQADPHVWDVDGRVALTRGPLIYCLEGRDHGGSLSGLRYCRDALYQPVPGDGVLAGEILLTGPGARRPATDRLYSSHAGETQACNLRAIPYFAWNNRGADEMDVWLPLQ